MTLHQLALDTIEELNILVYMSKLEGPATVVTILGILIDTVALQLWLPRNILCRLKNLIDGWSGRKSCTRKEPKSCLGHLSHAAPVIQPGRAFLRQLFSLLPLAKKPCDQMRLNSSVRADICWWWYFLQDWNGTFFIPFSQPTTGQVYSDASGSYSCETFILNGLFFQFQWRHTCSTIEISTTELIPVINAAAVWGKQHVWFNLDNHAVISILNFKTSKDTHLCYLLCTMFLYLAR